MTYNLFFLSTGDPWKEMLEPDLCGKMVKIEQGSNLLNQIFNLLPDMYGRLTQMNTSAGQYPTPLLGEVFLILLDQMTLRTLFQ
jgi:hypothetical protein